MRKRTRTTAKTKPEKPKAKDTMTVAANVGPVSVMLRSLTNSYYLLCWDSERQRVVRKSAKTKNLEDAKDEARKLKAQLAKGRKARLKARDERPTVDKAIDEAVKRGGRPNYRKTEEWEKIQKRFGGYFKDWLKEHRPSVRYWDEVDSRLVKDYIEWLDEKKMGPRTMRHYVGPLATASRYWNSVDDRAFRLMRIEHPSLELPEAAKNFLTITELGALIAKAKEMNIRNAFVGTVLGGLVGLRLREIAGVRREDFDAENRTLMVKRHSDLGKGRDKNPYSVRCIPLLPSVVKVLEWAFASDPSEWLVHFEDMPDAQGHNDTVARPLRRVMNALFKATKNAHYRDATPKDALRKTFMNYARKEADVDETSLQAYVGHSLRRNVMNAAYVQWTPKSPEDKELIEHLRRKVVGKLEVALAPKGKAADVVSVVA